jgi:site-specific DNA-cytosine methylase
MKKYNAIGINIYGGGFTLGVQRVFNVLGQWEEVTLGANTFELNFKNIPRPLDIRLWPIKEFENKVDFVYANPPCAPWSIANNHAGKTVESRFVDARLSLTEHTMMTALKLKPKVFISESVEAAYNTGQSFYDNFKDVFMKSGYAVTYFLTDAVIHGSPSKRRRFHFVASKVKLDFKEPNMDNFKLNTVKDAIADLEKKIGSIKNHVERNVNPWYKKFMPLTPPGGRLCDVMNAENGCPANAPHASFLNKRLIWNAPSFTLVGVDYIHPSGTRFLTLREGMRLLTFPDSFVAAKTIDVIDTVEPLMGEFLAKIALAGIKRGINVKPYHKIIDWRDLGKQFAVHKMKHLNKENL